MKSGSLKMKASSYQAIQTTWETKCTPPPHTNIHEYTNTLPRNRPRESNILHHDTEHFAVTNICSRKRPRIMKLQISHINDVYVPIVCFFVYHRCRKTVYLRCLSDRTLLPLTSNYYSEQL